jgi:hypothetical protein
MAPAELFQARLAATAPDGARSVPPLVFSMTPEGLAVARAEAGWAERSAGKAYWDNQLSLVCDPEGDATEGEPGDDGSQLATAQRTGGATFWSDAEWLSCSDGKARPVGPGILPLAHGVSFKLGSGGPNDCKSRVGMLRAAGNAIVPQVAAEFIKAMMP